MWFLNKTHEKYEEKESKIRLLVALSHHAYSICRLACPQTWQAAGVWARVCTTHPCTLALACAMRMLVSCVHTTCLIECLPYVCVRGVPRMCTCCLGVWLAPMSGWWGIRMCRPLAHVQLDASHNQHVGKGLLHALEVLIPSYFHGLAGVHIPHRYPYLHEVWKFLLYWYSWDDGCRIQQKYIIFCQ